MSNRMITSCMLMVGVAMLCVPLAWADDPVPMGGVKMDDPKIGLNQMAEQQAGVAQTQQAMAAQAAAMAGTQEPPPSPASEPLPDLPDWIFFDPVYLEPPRPSVNPPRPISHTTLTTVTPVYDYIGDVNIGQDVPNIS